MQNEKNQTKSLGEEGSEVSARMGFKVKNERNKTMINRKFGIRKTINTATSKSCPGSYAWLTRADSIRVWNNDPAEAKTWDTAEQAKQYKRNANLKGTVVEIR